MASGQDLEDTSGSWPRLVDEAFDQIQMKEAGGEQSHCETEDAEFSPKRADFLLHESEKDIPKYGMAPDGSLLRDSNDTAKFEVLLDRTSSHDTKLEEISTLDNKGRKEEIPSTPAILRQNEGLPIPDKDFSLELKSIMANPRDSNPATSSELDLEETERNRQRSALYIALMVYNVTRYDANLPELELTDELIEGLLSRFPTQLELHLSATSQGKSAIDHVPEVVDGKDNSQTKDSCLENQAEFCSSLFAEQMHEKVEVALSGPLDVQIFTEAWERVVTDHPEIALDRMTAEPKEYIISVLSLMAEIHRKPVSQGAKISQLEAKQNKSRDGLFSVYPHEGVISEPKTHGDFNSLRKTLRSTNDRLLVDPPEESSSTSQNEPFNIATQNPRQCTHYNESMKEEVVENIRKSAKQIFMKWKQLNFIVERYEATLRKKWRSNSVPACELILEKAWPSMHDGHRPDIRAYETGPIQGIEAFLWPHLNREDLAQHNRILMLLLNSRGRNKPSAFSRADYDACDFGRAVGAFDMLANEAHAVTTLPSAPTYSELLALGGPSELSDEFLEHCGLLFPQAYIIIKIQEHMYEFLVDCCLGILSNMRPEKIFDETIPIEPEPPSASSNKSTIKYRLISTLEAPYCLPAKFDWAVLRSIIGAKLAAAKDHVWALREDPGYFVRSIEIWRRHIEPVPELKFTEHQQFANQYSKSVIERSVQWKSIFTAAIRTSLMNMEMFAIADQQIAILMEKERIWTESELSTLPELTNDYMFTIAGLQYLLTEFVKVPVELSNLFLAPAILTRSYSLDGDPDYVPKTEVPVEELVTLLDILTNITDPQVKWETGQQFWLDELERSLEKQPKINTILTEWILGVLSDMAAWVYCLDQTRLYYPWSVMLPSTLDFLHRNGHLQSTLLQKIDMHMYGEFRLGNTAVALGNPVGNKFHYPVAQPKSWETTVAMRRAEHNLDTFWKQADKDIQASGMFTPYLKWLLSERTLERTLEGKGPLELDETEVQRVDGKDEWAWIEGPFEPKYDPHSPPPEMGLNVFIVDMRAYRTIKTIFHDNNYSKLRKPTGVLWKEFVHVMTSLGFGAEKLYCYTWQFNPTHPTLKHSIIFQEPHLDSKVPYANLRVWARRLKTAYGGKNGPFADI